MERNFADRLNKARKYCERVFIHQDFKSPKKCICFLKQEPKLNSQTLSQEDEILLFKKMNYLKYKAKKLLEPNEVSDRRLSKAESLINEALNVRNLIAEHNFRLANQLLKYDISFYRKRSLVDSLLSDAYFDIIKSIDYFNWTLGNRFSTYATWVVKKNFFRESKEAQKKSKKTVSLEDSCSNEVCKDTDSPLKSELDHKTRQVIVSSLLSMLESGDCAKDKKRQVFIIESYFGLNGRNNSTLESISGELGITKERVRQLKEKSISWLRSQLKQLNIEYDAMFDSVRY